MTAVRTAGGLVPLHSYKLLAPQGSASSVRSMVSAYFTSVTVDAAGERVAMIGRIKWSDASSHTVSSSGGSISFAAGAGTVWANASTSLDVGIQDVTAGSREPDGTFDVKATLVPGTETLTASATNTVSMETGSKTIADNDLIAVVWDMTARAGSDALPVGVINGAGSSGIPFPYVRFYNGAAWTNSANQPNVIIKADDGVYGWFEPWGYRPAAIGSQAYNSGTGTADEYGGRILLPWPVTVEAISVPIIVASGSSDFELCIYSDITGTPALVGGTVAATVDADAIAGNFGDYFFTVPFSSPKALAANTVYGWTVRPTTANNVTMEWGDFGSGNNALMASLMMGPHSYRIRRLDNTGAFTLTDTLHVPFVLHVSKFDDGAGGGGGLAANPIAGFVG